MKKSEKAAIIFFIIFVLVGVSILCIMSQKKLKADTSHRLQIITTLFPTYDFARQVAGDRADITLLLPNGEEAHGYEPTPQDMIRIRQADVFIYVGEELEPWAAQLAPNLMRQGVTVIDLSQSVNLLLEEEEGEEEGHEQNHHNHHHTYDPHVWTSPVNARSMVEEISIALQEIDKNNGGYYQERTKKYCAQLVELDKQIRQITKKASSHRIYFGGRFALHYFFHEYGLEEIAAYDSCGEEAEPNAKRIANIIEMMQENHAKVIFYEELVDPKAARIISRQTKAEVLLFHSCHNVTKEEMEEGATYLSLMKQNAKYLKKALE